MEPLEAEVVPRDLSHDRSPNDAGPRSVREILDGHVSLEVEGLDQIYLNADIPKLHFYLPKRG